MPVSFTMLNRLLKDDAEILFLELPIDTIPPGKYIFYFAAEEAGTKAASHIQVPLVINP
jgi:hypothetical protein